MEKISPKGQVRGCIKAPASKSYAQRAVAAALLAKGESRLTNMELCNDTRAAIEVAQRLGAKISATQTSFAITGGLNPQSNTLNIGESGLSTRLFTPIAALCETQITVMGQGSILNRPIEMMLSPLKQLGVEVESNDGLLPIVVKGPIQGGEIYVDGSASSQFITGLLMALPMSKHDTVLHVNSLKSRPYVDMTISLLRAFGIEVLHNDYTQFYVKGEQEYQPTNYNIEGDWSSASCLLVAGAIAGEITITNLNSISLQADLAIIEALTKAGAEITTTVDSVTVNSADLHAFDFDATHCPDLFPALAALAACCKGVSTITGTSRLIHKESNRARTIAQTFENMGIEVELNEENLMTIVGGEIKSGTVDSHNDHRIAMAAAVAGLRSDGAVTIRNANAVNKSYPDFWDDLASITY